MTQRIRFQLSELSTDEENSNLKKLLENFILRSEELEKKEGQVLQQVELLQSALSSLQAWNKEREEKSQKIADEAVHVNLDEIEEETRIIKAETDRIRKEIREKIEANKKLQDEIDLRKSRATGTIDEFVTESFIKNMEEETKKITRERQGKKESRTMESADMELRKDPGMKFVDEKLKKLEDTNKRLKREADEETKEMRKRRRELREKIDMLEWESEVDRQLLKNLKKKFGKT